MLLRSLWNIVIWPEFLLTIIFIFREIKQGYNFLLIILKMILKSFRHLKKIKIKNNWKAWTRGENSKQFLNEFPLNISEQVKHNRSYDNVIFRQSEIYFLILFFFWGAELIKIGELFINFLEKKISHDLEDKSQFKHRSWKEKRHVSWTSFDQWWKGWWVSIKNI